MKACRWNPLNKAVELLSFDVRSMALWRVAFGLITFFDCWDAMDSVYDHFSDLGALPSSFVLKHHSNPYYYSFHMMSGAPSFAAMMLVLQMVVGLLQAVGYYSRTMVFLNYVLTCSRQARCPIVLHGGDDYIRLVLFWMMFLPVGDCWSLDNVFHHRLSIGAAVFQRERERKKQSKSEERRGGAGDSLPLRMQRPGPNYFWALARRFLGVREHGGTCYFSLATVGYLSLICEVYMISTYFKTHPIWHTEFTATYWALQLDYYRTPLGDLMLYLGHGVLCTLTFLVFHWEFWGPVTLFVPVYTPYFRFVGCAGGFALHLGFLAGMRLGSFAFTGMFAFAAMLPMELWDALLLRLATDARRTLQVRYDAAVPLVRVAVQFIDGMLLVPVSDVAPAAKREKAREKRAGECAEEDVEVGEAKQRKGRRDGRADNLSDNNLSDASSFELDSGVWLYVRRNGRALHNGRALLALLASSPFFFYLPTTLPTASLDAMVAMYRARVPPGHVTPPGEYLHPVERAERKAYRRVHARARLRHAFSFCCRALVQALALSCALYMFLYNLHTVTVIAGEQHAPLGGLLVYRMPWQWIQWGNWLRLHAHWRMFSPHPPRVHVYHSFHAELFDGTKVELLKSGKLVRGDWELTDDMVGVDLDPPKWGMPYAYYNHRWVKYFENFNFGESVEDMRLELGRYICREWNSRHAGEKRIKRHQEYLSEYEAVMEPYAGKVFSRNLLLWDHSCF